MITNIKSSRLVVISDLHLGNPYSKNARQVVEFLRWASEEGYDVCINGDGFEIAQASFGKIVREIPEVIRAMRQVRASGRNIYYVVGNHDIAFEHFLEDWGALTVSPFLNVKSGNRRIRIEHGHLYDPVFIKHPHLYEFLTMLGGVFLKLHPSFYKLWISYERWQARVRAKKSGIVGEHPNFKEAAIELCRRGFDSVIFGHTHHRGEVKLRDGGSYLNCGSWLVSTHFVEVVNGETALKEWRPGMRSQPKPRILKLVA